MLDYSLVLSQTAFQSSWKSIDILWQALRCCLPVCCQLLKLLVSYKQYVVGGLCLGIVVALSNDKGFIFLLTYFSFFFSVFCNFFRCSGASTEPPNPLPPWSAPHCSCGYVISSNHASGECRNFLSICTTTHLWDIFGNNTEMDRNMKPCLSKLDLLQINLAYRLHIR